MKRGLLRFAVSAAVYYICAMYAHELLVMPNQVIRFSSFLPPLLGLLWGPVAAAGILLGEILTDPDWLLLPGVWAAQGGQACVSQAFVIFYRGAAWAGFAAYLPYRLWHSLLVDPEQPIFALSARNLLKYVYIVFLTTTATSLFLGLTTDHVEVARLFAGTNLHVSRGMEYALLCFFNDFDVAIFLGVPIFLMLLSYGHPFFRPRPARMPRPGLQCAFDAMMAVACALGISLCLSSFSSPWHEAWRFPVSAALLLYALRPLSPAPHPDARAQEAASAPNVGSRWMAFAMQAVFLAFFLLMDFSGGIHDLDQMDTWQVFNRELLTMMDVSLVALSYLFLRFRHSIMTNLMLLETLTVFISSFVLGCFSFMTVNRLIDYHAQDNLEKMSIICRERLARPFDNVMLSVNSMCDIALNQLDDYDRLVADPAYREDYAKSLEPNFLAIASNTEGSIGFYLRFAPEFAGSQAGLAWGREGERHWEGTLPPFRPRPPLDLAKFDPNDNERAGWYYLPVRRHCATWIEPYWDPATGLVVVSYVVPLYVEGQLLGIVGMDVDFDYIIHEVRRMSIYEHGYIYLLDRENRVLYHKDYRQGDLFTKSPSFDEAETYLINGIWLGIAGSAHDIYAGRNEMVIHLTVVMLFIALAISFLSIWLAAHGVRPLISLTAAAKSIANGDLDVKLDDASNDEIGSLVKSVGEMARKLDGYMYRDKLTGLRNVAAYMRKVADLDARRQDAGLEYAIIVFDANFLKRINDHYGHEAGNQLICHASALICRVFAHSLIYRIGGDEFVAILEGEDYAEREELLQRFDEESSQEHFTHGEHDLPVSVARGIAAYEVPQAYADVFLKADAAMYEHKAGIKKRMNLS